MNSTLKNQIAQVERQVKNQLKGRIRNLHLELADGGVVLHGRADSFHTKQLAQHAVFETAGLPLLGNEIEVVDGNLR